MAGKKGAAAELMRAAALKLAERLDQHARALAALPSPEDGPGIEKDAKHAKAVADAGRSIVALEQAADKALAVPAPARPASTRLDGDDDGDDDDPQPDEMDMDDDDFAALDPDVVTRRCADFDAHVGRLVGQLECKGLGGRARGLRQVRRGEPPAGHAPPRSAPA